MFFSNPYLKSGFYTPAIFNGGHIASPLSVHPVHTSRPICTKNGFRAISFENIGVLDSYFIHRYIIIKYRSSYLPIVVSVMALDLCKKMVSGLYLLNALLYWIHISYTGI